MTDEEFLAAGCNISGIHGDFIIGSGEMRVDGILENGEIEAILCNGEWAFDVLILYQSIVIKGLRTKLAYTKNSKN